MDGVLTHHYLLTFFPAYTKKKNNNNNNNHANRVNYSCPFFNAEILIFILKQANPHVKHGPKNFAYSIFPKTENSCHTNLAKQQRTANNRKIDNHSSYVKHKYKEVI
jgi:hypothetical protein